MFGNSQLTFESVAQWYHKDSNYQEVNQSVHGAKTGCLIPRGVS